MLNILQDQTYRGEDWWDWSVWLDGPKEEMDAVERVLWRLHPTFTPSTVTTTDRNAAFRLRTSGWGTFKIRADVALRGGGERRLEHELELFYPDTDEPSSRRPSEKDGIGGYVHGVPVPPVPAASRDAGASDQSRRPQFRSGPQVLVVRSHIVEFSAAVPEPMKVTVSHGLLFGQLAADKATESAADHLRWYEAYKSVLTNIGWSLRTAQPEWLTVSDTAAMLGQAMVPILASILGPRSAAGSRLLATLNALPSVDAETPWLVLFQENAQSGRGARLGVSYVDSEGEAAILKSIYFDVVASSPLTQVLFSKAATAGASVRFAADELTLNRSIMSDTASSLARKVEPFVATNIVEIEA
jgi:hypothetical protein